MRDIKFSTGRVLVGDCVERMRGLPDCSVDAVVCDPPYELGFMGKKWDSSGIAYNVDMWAEALRVLKPGGHLLAFGGTRTYHRMVVAIEDAGFEVRDCLSWLYGSGFPKSLNVGKAIDKRGGSIPWQAEFAAHLRDVKPKGVTTAQINAHVADNGSKSNFWGHFIDVTSQPRPPTCEQYRRLRELLPIDASWDDRFLPEAEREVVGTKKSSLGGTVAAGDRDTEFIDKHRGLEFDVTAPATDEARRWEGWGTALKPAHEPIVMARKPLIGTVAANVLKHGTGALNIDGCRVGKKQRTTSWSGTANYKVSDPKKGNTTSFGRWPANVLLDEGAAAALDEQNEGSARYFTQADWGPDDWPFVYQAKPSKRERNAGTEHLPTRSGKVHAPPPHNLQPGESTGTWTSNNFHPTVKPVALMRHLVRLVTPQGGVVLDPFLGSGTTAVAAVLEGFSWIGCEMTDDYLPIIKGRVEWAEKQVAEAAEDGEQLTLGGDE